MTLNKKDIKFVSAAALKHVQHVLFLNMNV